MLLLNLQSFRSSLSRSFVPAAAFFCLCSLGAIVGHAGEPKKTNQADPAVSHAESLELLRDAVDENTNKLSDQLGKRRMTEGENEAALKIFDMSNEILKDEEISDAFRVWTLRRRAVALTHLAYEDPPRFFPVLESEIETLENQQGCEKIARVVEEHVLRIASSLAVRPSMKPDGKPFGVNPRGLAEWLVDFMRRHPGRESEILIEDALYRINHVPSLYQRDKLLASVVPVFVESFLESESQSEAALGKKLLPTARRVMLPGRAMRLAGYDLQGEPFNPAVLDGKVVLVVFWGTWCVPCREKTPQLIDLYEKYRSRGFEIVGVNTGTQGGDDKPEKVRRYVEKTTFGSAEKKITWPILLDSLAVNRGGVKISDYYGIDILPETVLIGRDGKVLKLNPLPGALDHEIRGALRPRDSDAAEDPELREALRRQDEELQQELEMYMKRKGRQEDDGSNP